MLFVRIDDRLIHGQIIEGWLPYLKTNEVLVVSDALCADELQKTLLSLALPDAIRLEILDVARAVEYLKDSQDLPQKRVLVLVPSPQEALALLERGLSLSQINVGGLHHSVGKIQLGRALFLSPQDKHSLKEILRRGVHLEGRAVPGESPTDLQRLLE
ncbi:MAG: PTS sugar transporter subunit IIB [Elusimicrobia bacterium]|nr:PTS sugar transporter subunit IIB [Elusimicrobiota bacterium]